MMSAHTLNRSRAAWALALTTLAIAAAAPASAADQVRSSASGLGYGPSAATELACKTSKLATAKDHWVEANGTSVEGGDTRRMTLIFSDPVTTDTFHAAMNDVSARELALVEIQDAKGSWSKAWQGRLPAPAPGFEQSCFEQKLAQKQAVKALRFSFRVAPGQIEVNHAALLRH
jgi:hypothetical protein